ncbi:hypothetical protein IL306_014427 [Fusarium sp. DS 682]|nr:hypothetical protein IL306_014427 [Fusarium sp. DS 682]
MASQNSDRRSSSSLYQPLNKDKREIRLLEILPNTPDGKVNCKLHTVLLTPDLYYVCISYVWGPDVKEEIFVNDISQEVRVNLVTALRHVKKQWTEIELESNPELDTSKFRLWADALCIDQTDDAERTHQVNMMADIYSLADMVLGWLSSNDEKVVKAFDIFKRIVQIAERQVGPIKFAGLHESEICELGSSKVSWDSDQFSWLFPSNSSLFCQGDLLIYPNELYAAVLVFCKLEFWNRVWIHQEVILAKRLYSPSHVLQHSVCFMALIGLENYLERIAETSQEPAQRLQCRQFKFIFSRPFELFTTRLWSLEDDYGFEMWRLNLYFSLNSKATKNLDYVYGLLAVTKSPIIPDYNKSVREVNLEFMEWAVPLWKEVQEKARQENWEERLTDMGKDTWRYEVSNLLNSHAVGVKRTHELPSWAPVFSMTDRRDPMVRDPTERVCVFETVPKLFNRLPIEVAGDRLLVEGIKVQPVKKVYDEAVSDKCLETRLRRFIDTFSKWRQGMYPGGKSILEVLCCTLLRKEACERFAFELSIWLDYSKQGDVVTNGQWKCLPLPGSYIKSVLSEWKLAGTTFKGNRLFTTKDGYIGTMSDDVQPGDVVCVLAGSNELAVLRPEDDYYLFVGCCFMIGLMKGEVADLLASGKAKLETIELR